ncbi:MAG: YdcF family protein [Victivallales bacterium]|nr:YdcF family protein [Victivallales bacterium]
MVLLALLACVGLTLLERPFDACSARVYERVEDVPACDVGVLLGTSPKSFGLDNLYFLRRIDAAEQLYRAGRIRKILLSGSSRPREGYDEIASMREALLAREIPAEALLEDGAGHRTILSILNLRDQFHLREAVVISQRFHCERAIYLADHAGITLCGFAARDVRGVHRVKRFLRETAARCYATLEAKSGKLSSQT